MSKISHKHIECYKTQKKKKINELINYIEKSWDQKYKAVMSRVLAIFLCLLATQFLQFPGNNFTF